MKHAAIFAALLFAGLWLASPADAACRCACVNGHVQALCTSFLDIEPICPPRICRLPPPSIEPLPSLQLPPLGARDCRQVQVQDYFGRYRWQRVCR